MLPLICTQAARCSSSMGINSGGIFSDHYPAAIKKLEKYVTDILQISAAKCAHFLLIV